MAEGESNASTQQQGAGEAKTDAQNAADQNAAQGDGEQGSVRGGQGASGNDGKTGESGTDRSDSSNAEGQGGSGKGSGDSGAAGGRDGKGADADGKAKAAVPEKYDLKLSDGSLLDSSTVDRIAAIAREQGLSNEDAQKRLAEIETQAMQERNARVTSWSESLKTDKDFGGENYEASVQSVQRYAGHLRQHYPELVQVLEHTGYASHPAVARFLRDMGNRMAEDKHTGKSSATQQKEPERTADLLYGETTPTAKPVPRKAA